MLKRTLLPTLLFLFAALVLVAQTETGKASYYNNNLQGKKTASGEPYDKDKLTAAHRTYPFGTKVKVTNLDNKKTVIVTINDRGPHTEGRVVDLSYKAADAIELIKAGVAKVQVEVIKDDIAPIEAAPLPMQGKTPIKGDLYKVQVKAMPKEGWGVQIGTYNSYENFLQAVSEMQEDWFSNILVLMSGTDNNMTFRLILGPFLDKPTAESYQKNLKKNKKMEGFVVDLGSF